MAAMSRPALQNGIAAFPVLLVPLAMSLLTVIRLPARPAARLTRTRTASPTIPALAPQPAIRKPVGLDCSTGP